MSDDIVGSGTSTTYGYMVEARVENMNHSKPVTLRDGVLSEKWRQISFDKTDNPAGVPPIFPNSHFTREYLTYESALALAWTIIAQWRHYPIECRLVKYKIVETHSCKKEGLVDLPIIKQDWLSRPKVIQVKDDVITPQTPTTPPSASPPPNE